MDALERATVEVLAEEEEADADFARVLAHQRAFRAEYALWRELAYPAEAESTRSRPASSLRTSSAGVPEAATRER